MVLHLSILDQMSSLMVYVVNRKEMGLPLWMGLLFCMLTCYCFNVQEAAIEEYFKPIDKDAEIIMKMQLEGEEKSMKEMMKVMQTQTLLERAEAEKGANSHNLDTNQHSRETDSSSSTKQHAQIR